MSPKVTELIIRKANIEDLDGLVEIEQACFDVPWSRESLEKDLTENPMALVIAAVTGGKLVGYVDVWLIEEEGHINNVAVLPEYQGMGIGMILFNTMIEVTERAGIQSHTLEVARGNDRAIDLYEKFGFQEAGVRPGYYENGDDAIIMWRLGDPGKVGEGS